MMIGNYNVVRQLWSGVVSSTYLCRDERGAGGLIAVKVAYEEMARDEYVIDHFLWEYEMGCQVSHPNVLRYYELLSSPDVLALTMEYAPGGSLADKTAGGAINAGEVVELLSQICLGVQAIHEAGIVHACLELEHMLLSDENRVKVADFGIAFRAADRRRYIGPAVIASTSHITPEYLLYQKVDKRSDIYAIGHMAYEMLTGRTPFAGDSVPESIGRLQAGELIRPRALCPDCPRALEEVILKALAREPDDRYQEAKEMYEECIAIG